MALCQTLSPAPKKRERVGNARLGTKVDNTDEDVEDMYHIYEGKKEILLWSTQADHLRKRAHSPDVEESEKRSRYDKYLDKMTEVETIEQELKETHAEGTYSDLQLRSWAHLIQMGQMTLHQTKGFIKQLRRPILLLIQML